MCLILLAYRFHPRYPLVVAANRDEFYRRPTQAAHFWSDQPQILAGRDLEQMGTWLGVTTNGRFAALTNYRAPSLLKTTAVSRGEVVSGFLRGDDSPRAYISRLQTRRDHFNGFNLLLGDSSGLFCYSQVSNRLEAIEPGVHGLSNRFLDTPWVKVTRGRERLQAYLQAVDRVDPADLLDLLADPARARSEALPDTGIGPEWESILSAIFIASPDYGTRSSTVLLADADGRISLTERTFVPGQKQGPDVYFEFDSRKGET